MNTGYTVRMADHAVRIAVAVVRNADHAVRNAVAVVRMAADYTDCIAAVADEYSLDIDLLY